MEKLYLCAGKNLDNEERGYFLSRKTRDYFIKSKLHHVRSWVGRVQLNMDIAQMIEQTTSQDIRKRASSMPKNPIGKRIQFNDREKKKLKKLRQSKIRMCNKLWSDL